MNAFPVAVAVGTLLLVAADGSRACGEALRGTTGRAENARYEIVFAAVPAGGTRSNRRSQRPGMWNISPSAR